MYEVRVITTYILKYKHSFVLRQTVLLVLSVWLALAEPASALACGMPLEARIPSEQALIVYDRGRETIITSVQLLSEKGGAAVVFPVPGIPEVDVLPSSQLFSYLAEVTRPRERIEEQLTWRNRTEAVGGAAPGVSLLGQEIVGGYSVARLAADDPNALQAWLDEHGYQSPSGAAPILRAYTDAGWKFVAVKLAPDRPAAGALEPLRIAFDAPEIVYPMRLGALSDRPIDVLLYVVADHRVEIDGLETQYAGPVAQLDRGPPAELAPVLAAPYLTKLRNSAIDPTTLTSDYIARPAPDNTPFRKEVIRVVYVDGWQRMTLPIFGLVAALFCSALALGIAFGLRRRIDQIAGPPPEEDDD